MFGFYHGGKLFSWFVILQNKAFDLNDNLCLLVIRKLAIAYRFAFKLKSLFIHKAVY